MKSLRHALLILLMLLLPLRGAVAAAMLCPMADPAESAVSTLPMAAGHGAQAMAAAQADPAVDQHTGPAVHDHDGHPAGGPDQCHLCSACCAATPLMSTALSALPPVAVSAVEFPALRAPAPSFIVTGPERPPRSV